jgi:hypothetical protein
MERQMFAKGGAAFPDISGDGKVTQKDILMGRGVEFKQAGGIAGMMAEQPPSMPSPQMVAGMAGGQAGMMQEPGAAVQQAAGAIDPAMLEQALTAAAEGGIGDLENIDNVEDMMNAIRGDDATVEDRYEELAAVVGPEDARQTPESVLALVQPVMMMAAVDQGIGGLAQEEMTEPVEGAMAEGIMSTVAPPPQEAAPMPPAGMGGPPPVNFNKGGLVRRGDNQPVQMYAPGGEVTDPIAASGRLGELYQEKVPLYQSIIGDQSGDLQKQKELTQSQMLFDIANTALAFAAPMEGERRGMSPAERLAYAARTTQLPQMISARAGEQLKAEQAAKAQQQQMKLSALGAAETGLAAEAKAAADLKQTEIKGAQKIAEITLEDKLASASAQALESQRQTGRVDLEDVKQKNREALEGIVQNNKVAIETLRQTGSQENIILADKLEKENIELRGNIELGKLDVANQYEIAKMDKAHEQATELQTSRLTVQKNIADNRLELDTINSALNQARADKELALKQENLALAQQTEARIKELEEQKLALDTRKVDLEAAAQSLNQFGTSVDGRVMNIITGKGVFQPNETASMLASRYARGETTADEDIVLNQAIEYFVAPKPVWDAENKRYTLSEGNPLAQEWRQAVEKRKGLENKTVPTLGGAVTSSQSSLVTPSGAPTIDNLGASVIENLNATSGNLPSLTPTGQPVDIKDTTYNSIIAGLDPTLATGSPSAFKQALNRTAETLLPVFGQPFPETSRAVTLLDNLNTTTTALIMQANPGRESEQFRQDIKAIFPVAGAWTKGDQTSLNQVKNTIAYLNQEISNLSAERSRPVSEARIGELDRSIVSLLAVRDTYAQLGRGYEAQNQGGGDMSDLFK